MLSADPRAYADTGTDQMSDIPPEVPVFRAFALETTRHLSVRGRYLSWMALPDRWVSWAFSAIPAGMRLISKYSPRVIWSTYPIATAHVIGFVLHRITGIPWVADFRDPMTEVNPRTGEKAPSDPSLWKIRSWIERLAVKHAVCVVFAAPGAHKLYAERYQGVPESRWSLIQNGYDEQAFVQAEKQAANCKRESGKFVLLHSGVLYNSADRDPSQLFVAVAKLRARGVISVDNFKIVLRASGYDDEYRQLLRMSKLEDLVSLEPALPYHEALAEMLAADGLLVFQGYTSNPAIPAKVYEYLRARRPIFALVDSQGDTARLLEEGRVGRLVPLDSADQIEIGLEAFLKEVQSGMARIPELTYVKQFSRQHQAVLLAGLLNRIVDKNC